MSKRRAQALPVVSMFRATLTLVGSSTAASIFPRFNGVNGAQRSDRLLPPVEESGVRGVEGV
jgi:hypothetical protein